MDEPLDTTPSPDARWDAGNLGCGDLVLGLRTRLLAMPGKVLELIARDPGAPQDIPAFCRMTGHVLVRAKPETCTYWIRARAQ